MTNEKERRQAAATYLANEEEIKRLETSISREQQQLQSLRIRQTGAVDAFKKTLSENTPERYIRVSMDREVMSKVLHVTKDAVTIIIPE